MPKIHPRARKFWLEWVRPLLVIVIVLSAVRSSIADWNDVPSGSMSPSVLVGERIFVNKLAYDLKVPFTRWRLATWDTPHRGDVVIFFEPKSGTRMIKRVVGLPGDILELRNNELLINGEPAAYRHDPASPEPTHLLEDIAGRSHPIALTPGIRAKRWFGPVIVPDGHYFVMGDNRDDSRDSRYFGFVPASAIAGEATRVVISLDPSRRYLPRWKRFGHGID